MAGQERLLKLLLVVGSLIPCGCQFLKSRRTPLPVQPVAPLPSPLAKEMAAQPAIEPPTPPQPPMMVQPPRPDALSGLIPPIPRGGAPAEMPPATIPDSPIVPVSLDSTDAEPGGPLREKLEELKQRVKERREERQERREEKKSPPPPPPAPQPPPTIPDSAPAQSGLQDEATQVKKLLDAATARYAEVNDFEARLIKQEVIHGKLGPREESLYRFRKQPLSVYNQVLSEAGQGREMMYVRGQFGDKMHLITGKGDNPLVGAGFKTDLDPDSKTATAKSRWKVYEAGFSRNLASLGKALSGTTVRQPLVKMLGESQRDDYPHLVLGVEFSVRPGEELHLPKGGRRKMFFDNDPKSVAYRLPVVVQTFDPEGKEVEYYCFSQFKIPSGWTDQHWNPSRLGKK